MNYIRSCSNCKSELRFPVDKGTIRVICPRCGVSFIMDPDDPATFESGSFEHKYQSTIKHEIGDVLYLPLDFIAYHYKKLIPGGFRPQTAIKLLLFGMLALYIIRGCTKEPSTGMPENRIEETSPVPPPEMGDREPAFQI